MIKPLIELVSTNLKHFFREPGTLFWAMLFPVILAWLLGLSFSNRGEIRTHVGIVSQPKNLLSLIQSHTLKGSITAKTLGPRRILITLTALPQQPTIVMHSYSLKNAKYALKSGNIDLFITNPLKKDMMYYFDPQNQAAYQSYLLLNQAFSGKTPAKIAQISGKGTRYIDFLIPGLMCLTIMQACLWGIGFNLVELRIRKLLRRMVATPMSKTVFLLSHWIGRLFTAFVEFILLFGFALYYFGLTIQGSLVALAIILIVGHLCFAGIAILASSRARTNITGNGIISAITLPMILLSGIFFSYHYLPQPLPQIVQYLPLTILVDTVRNIVNFGANVQDIIIPCVKLLGFSILCFWLGLKLYRWD